MKVKDLVPESWIQKEEDNSITLWYSAKRGNHNRKSFTFPKEILIDKTFAEAIGMIIGDGDMHRKEKGHLNFVSKDLDIAAFVLNFFRERLLLNIKDITLLIQHRNVKLNLLKIVEKLNISKNRFKERFSLRHRHPAIQIQVNGTVFRRTFEKIVKEFLSSNFLEKQELRRGFLSGLFAAEGCVGVKWKDRYINQIDFTLAAKEKDYVRLLQQALSLEDISFKTVEMNSCIETVIQNWQNYLKLWQIGLFDRCERKKKAFLSIAKTSRVSVFLTEEDLQMLSNKFKQRDLAKIVGSWQGNVSRTLKGDFLFSLDQIRTLEARGFFFQYSKIKNWLFDRIALFRRNFRFIFLIFYCCCEFFSVYLYACCCSV